MEPFRARDVDEFIDVFLLNEDSANFDCGTIRNPERKILFNLKTPENTQQIFNARIVFIAPGNFAEWTAFLLEQIIHTLHSNIKIFILSHGDLAFLNEHFLIFSTYFPKAEFWIQNWIGDLPYIKSLPIGVNTYFSVAVERTELFFISFVIVLSSNSVSFDLFSTKILGL